MGEWENNFKEFSVVFWGNKFQEILVVFYDGISSSNYHNIQNCKSVDDVSLSHYLTSGQFSYILLANNLRRTSGNNSGHHVMDVTCPH